MSKQAKTALAKLLANVTDDSNYSNVAVKNQGNVEKDNKDNIVDFDSRLTIHSINPNKCHLWSFADRPDDELGDIEGLAESIKRVGQQEPILVRPSKEDGQYEIIFGNRRWRACQLIDRNVQAVIHNVSDQDAALIQKEENTARENISDYARAKSYDKLLKAGIFQTETDLSRHLNISPQNLNDIFAFLRVPKELVELMPNFKYLSRRLVVKLASLSKKKHYLPVLLNLTNDINDKNITSSNIDRILERQFTIQQKSNNENVEIPDNTIKIKYKGNNAALEIKTLNNGVLTIKVHKSLSNKISMEELLTGLKNIYQLSNEL